MKIDFKPAEIFRGTRLYRQANNLAYAYITSHAAADADGAPNAYHPADVHKNCLRDAHIGLDCLGNAGYPNTDWWDSVLVPDPKDKHQAYVQSSGPTKGFFVAQTSLRKPSGDPTDPDTYVDSVTVPYVVIPTGFTALPHVAGQGDVGLATHLATSKSTPFIVADSGGGSDAKLGEGSIALYAALGFPNVNPRNGDGLPKDDIQYILFPKTRRPGDGIWPRTQADIAAQVAELIRVTPGIG